MKNKRLLRWPVTLVATSDWPDRFPETNREIGISEHLDQNVDCTNIPRRTVGVYLNEDELDCSDDYEMYFDYEMM